MAREERVYTVIQINTYIKRLFEGDMLLHNLKIKGELSNVKYHSSGHIYFSLKDESSMISGVMFSGDQKNGLDFHLENGQMVIVSGNISSYERDGKYQIYARNIALEGSGNLYEAYERLKQKLFEEGLFDFEIKKEIPKYPKKVGIVTAETGAAIRDICNVAKRRNPYVQLYLFPAKVQGEGAAQSIVKGIETLDKMGMDTIIIGRGGGSIEDLWAFNEEIVARAIYAANTPIVSGTGHEIDNTIADYAADLRAATPSAASEQVIPDILTLLSDLEQNKKFMTNCIQRKLGIKKQHLDNLYIRLNNNSPTKKIENQKIYLDTLYNQLEQEIKNKYLLRKNRFDLLLAKLNGLSPTAKLIGGYGYIEKEDGRALLSANDVKEGEDLKVVVHDGAILTTVKQISENDE